MSDRIKVDTNEIDGYIARINNQINKAVHLDSNLIAYSNAVNYRTIYKSLNNTGSLADYVWRLRNVISNLQRINQKVIEIENFLSQIDPADCNENISIVQLRDKKVKNFEDTLGNKMLSELVPFYGAEVATSAYFYAQNNKRFSKMLEKDAKALKKIVKASNAADGELFGELTGFKESSILKNLSQKTNLSWKDYTSAGWDNFKEEVFGGLLDKSDDTVDALGNVTKATKVTRGISVVAEGLDLFSKGVENVEEQGGFTERAVKETVTEYVVDSVIDSTIKAVVGTALTGLALSVGIATGGIATVAIPVIAAVATVGIKFCIDKICESITGKDATEFISDALIDTAENVKNVISTELHDTANSVRKVVSGEGTNNDFGNIVKTQLKLQLSFICPIWLPKIWST